MKKIAGLSASKGIAIGRIRVYLNQVKPVDDHKIEDTREEFERFISARDKAVADLGSLSKIADSKVGGNDAQIFSMQQMLLNDPDFENEVRTGICDKKQNAEYAVKEAGEAIAKVFLSMSDNSYMQQRSADFIDIANRVVHVLQDGDQVVDDADEPAILVAKDLTPGETIQMDTTRILSFVTSKGSVNSHTAILARSLGITAVVDTGIEADTALNGHMCIVDGTEGTLYIDPDEATMELYKGKKKVLDDDKAALSKMVGMPTVTVSGRKIQLFANVGNVGDVLRASQSDAEGIGLFRSEFLYIGRKDFPSEEEQFQSYKKAAEIMKGKEVIIRTLDIGADKKADYFELKKEDNPAMGMRAIRICLTRPEIFKTQLRAIYRASAFGTISIMFPMITSVKEVDRILEITEEVKKELDEKSISYGQVKRGIMVETPAAAIISDLLAEKVDFFSIGTNDLTQYTLAIDRQNAEVTQFVDTHHPALLRLIEMVVRNAHSKNVKVGICGELGADPALTEFFINTGVDELSVSAPGILALRRHIRELA